MSLVTVSFTCFCIVLFTAYYAVGRIAPRWQWVVLLLASIVFYLFSGPWNIVLLMITIVVTYVSVLWMDRVEDEKKRRWILAGCLIVSLGLLALCKYDASFIMPLGISFYTFQALSYVMDCYRRKIDVQKNFLQYVLFVSFFPQIGQGPIGRYERLAPQLYGTHMFDYDRFVQGVIRMLIGAFKKLFVANQLALFVDAMYESPGEHAGISLVLASICYTIQLYADFSGYMDLAIGAAQACGIMLDENFRAPYFATSIRDFWGRWHITLSSWLRDYLYIPLGGNRKGELRKNLNIMIVMLLSGIWHGNGWNFLIWGGLHGLYQVVENIERSHMVKEHKDNKALKVLKVARTFFWVNLAWVFFRLPTLDTVGQMAKQIAFGFFRDGWKAELWNPETFYSAYWIWALLGILVMIVMDVMTERGIRVERFVYERPIVIRWLLLFCLCFAIFVFSNPEAAGATNFLYYRF